MKTILRCLGALLLLAGAAGLPARAQDYPNKPIRLIIGYPPGGGTDIMGRILADAMIPRLGQQIVVENRPGAGSAIAAGDVSKAAPDGYTLLWIGGDTITIQPALKTNIPFKVPDGFTYVFRAMQSHLFVTASMKAPFTTLAQMVAYAKANPGKIRYGSPGVGSTPHMGALLLEQQAGIKMTHVPYRGSAPAMVDTIAGFIDMAYQTLATVGDQAKAGKLRLLAVSSDTRDPAAPEVPTLAESGYAGATLSNWFALMGPPGLPADVLARLRKAGEAAMADPTLRARIGPQGFDAAYLSGDAFHKIVVDDLARWQAIAKAANLHVTD